MVLLRLHMTLLPLCLPLQYLCTLTFGALRPFGTELRTENPSQIKVTFEKPAAASAALMKNTEG
jgi:hypothetical protein